MSTLANEALAVEAVRLSCADLASPVYLTLWYCALNCLSPGLFMSIGQQGAFAPIAARLNVPPANSCCRRGGQPHILCCRLLPGTFIGPLGCRGPSDRPLSPLSLFRCAPHDCLSCLPVALKPRTLSFLCR